MANPEALIQELFGPASRLAQALPEYEPRPLQMRMAQRVAEALGQDRIVLLEAGTGTGKTLAYLLPLLAMGRKGIVSTATKALQDQIIAKDVPLLRRVAGRTFQAAALKGRGNYLCPYRLRAFQKEPLFLHRGEGRWFEQVVAWAAETVSGDRDEIPGLPERVSFWPHLTTTADTCLGAECPDFARCFLMQARNRAREADLVVVNHHLFFADLAVRQDGFGEILPDYDAVVFDEAHQVPEVVSRFFGLELSNYQLRELVQDLRQELHAVGADDLELMQAMTGLEDAAAGLRRAFPEEDRREGLSPPDLERTPGRALVTVESALHGLLERLAPHRIRGVGVASGYRRAEQMLETAGVIRTLDDPGRVYWYETRGRGVFLQASPLEVGPALKEALYPALRCAVFTSATLATGQGAGAFDFTLEQLGLDRESAASERLPPAFDFQRQSLLYLPVNLPEPDRPGFQEALVAEITALLKASSGRAFCLFTSHRMMSAVHAALSGRIPYPILVQGQGSKQSLLDDFRSTPSVLLGTSSFWEGVDVPGEALSLVVIDRLPFVSPGDPLVAARSRHLEQQGKNPFMALYVPKAILSLKQGLGRLLRRSTDRGAMAILDVRLTRRRYGRMFLAGLPPVRVTREVGEVYRFFHGGPDPTTLSMAGTVASSPQDGPPADGPPGPEPPPWDAPPPWDGGV